MTAFAAHVEHADRMMISARGHQHGIEFTFADGCAGLVPFSELPEVGSTENIRQVRWPNPYEVVLETHAGESIEIPWDFARAYCDPSYRPRVEAIAVDGRLAIGERIRQLRLSAHMTQDALASAANIGRVTLVRIESGEQSPRHETLLALAAAMDQVPGALLTAAP